MKMVALLRETISMNKEHVSRIEKSSLSREMTAAFRQALAVRAFPPEGLPSIDLSYD